jgi:nitroreductase
MLLYRKTLRIYFLCFIFLFFGLAFPYVVNASAPIGYSVSEIHMRAKLNADGSMDIHEFVTYKLSPEYDGQIEKYINISRASEVIGLEVSAISRDTLDEPIVETEMLTLKFVESPTDGQTGVYTFEFLEVGQNKFKVLSVFLPAGKNNVTIALRYSLSDMVYLYNDASLLQWQFVPQTESDITGLISIELNLPQKNISEKINAFAHGSQNIDDTVINDSSIAINADGLRQSEFLEAFVLMPVNAVPNGRKIVDNYILSDMLEFKEHLAYQSRQVELKQEQRKRSVTIAGLILLLTGLGLGSYFYAYSLKKSVKEDYPIEQLDEIEYQSKLPEHYYTPAELSVLVNRSRITSRDVIATLMDMVVKGNLLLEAYTSNECRTLKFVLNEGCHIGRLEPHEEYLINWMLKDIGSGSGFSILDIKSITSNPSLKGRFLSKFDTWTRIVIKQAARWNFEQKISGKPSKLTPFGLAHFSQWMAFKKFVKNYSGDDAMLSLSDWERYMVFIVPLDEAQHIATRLLSLYPQESFDKDNLTLLKRQNFELFEHWFDCMWEEQ